MDQHEKHLDEWAGASAEFIRDGVIDPESWRQSDLRVLFLMKEDYGTRVDNDLRVKILRKANIDAPDLGKGTLKVAAQWAYACQNYNSAIELPRKTGPAQALAFRQTAWVNLKKTRGATTSSKQELETYLSADENENAFRILKQIQLITPAPQLVICGGTWNLASEFLWPAKDRRQRIFDNATKIEDGPFVINFCHPGARYPHALMFQALCSILRGIAANAPTFAPS